LICSIISYGKTNDAVACMRISATALLFLSFSLALNGPLQAAETKRKVKET
jgi:hypothetical protein